MAGDGPPQTISPSGILSRDFAALPTLPGCGLCLCHCVVRPVPRASPTNREKYQAGRIDLFMLIFGRVLLVLGPTCGRTAPRETAPAPVTDAEGKVHHAGHQSQPWAFVKAALRKLLYVCSGNLGRFFAT